MIIHIEPSIVPLFHRLREIVFQVVCFVINPQLDSCSTHGGSFLLTWMGFDPEKVAEEQERWTNPNKCFAKMDED
jgi:hypothetical protein